MFLLEHRISGHDVRGTKRSMCFTAFLERKEKRLLEREINYLPPYDWLRFAPPRNSRGARAARITLHDCKRRSRAKTMKLYASAYAARYGNREIVESYFESELPFPSRNRPRSRDYTYRIIVQAAWNTTYYLTVVGVSQLYSILIVYNENFRSEGQNMWMARVYSDTRRY